MNLVLLVQENRVLYPLWVRLSKIIKAYPYYIVKEVKLDEDQVHVTPSINDIEIRFLDSTDMKEITSHLENNATEAEYVKRLQDGCLCLGGKHNGNIIGYTWCSLNEYEHNSLITKLRPDEAYLFDARTFHEYRGKNIAPYLRYKLYEYLYSKGITTYYSLTIYKHTSSLAFKRKLGGRPVKLMLYIGLFNSFHIHMPVKKYTSE